MTKKRRKARPRWVPKVGDWVRRVPKYCDGDAVPRQVTNVRKSEVHDGGYAISVNDGGLCPQCRKPLAEPISNYSVEHFQSVKLRSARKGKKK